MATMITQQQVNQTLNNALENGYPIDQWPIQFLIEDIILYDKQFENVKASDIIPFIKRWKSKYPTAY